MEGNNVSDAKVYRYETGIVQAFTKDGVKQPAVKVGNHNGQNVYSFTIKSATVDSRGQQAYFDVSMWSGDFGDVGAKVTEGCFVAVDGQLKQKPKEGGGFWNTITASRIAIVPGVVKLERTVENAVAPVAAVPVAAAPVAEAAPAAGASAPISF